MSLPVADPAPAAPCYMQLVLPLHVKNDRQEQLGCALRACPEAENTMLTWSSVVRSHTIRKAALHIPDASVPSCPFIKTAVLQLKCTALCVGCNAVTHQRNVEVLNFHTIPWNDTRWYFWDEKQSMQQFCEKNTSEGVKETVKCIIKNKIWDCEDCFLLATTHGLFHPDWPKIPTEIKSGCFARIQ